MTLLRRSPIMVAALLLVACTTIVPSSLAAAATLHLEPNALADGPGVPIAQALSNPGQSLLINGLLLIEADGTAWLCDALAESFPPQCSGDRLRVANLADASGLPKLASGNGVKWSEGQVQLLGTVREG